MEGLLNLLNDAPARFKDKARKGLLEVVNEYEDWKSLGYPDPKRYDDIKFRRRASRPMTFQEFIRTRLKNCE